MDITEELRLVLAALRASGVEHAIVGAFAVAIHGAPRATTDIDILVRPESVAKALEAVAPLGFTLEALPMKFDDGMELRRVSKVVGEDLATLDLILVDANLEPVWASRLTMDSDLGPVVVVGRDALIRMKVAAGRHRDLADVERLRDLDR